MRDTRSLVSWEDFKKKEFDSPTFLVTPYIPTDGIVLLWGETSTGKSPVGWHLAAAVGRGDNFMGLPATQGRVLYLEVDTHQRLVHSRLSQLDSVPNVDFLFLPPLSVPDVSPADDALLRRAAANDYDLVVVNTLRKVHCFDDKDSKTPQIVYSYFQHLFPGSSLVFVHHTKKTTFDSGGKVVAKEKESFSGANNWLNDAQVGLLLQKYENEREGVNLRLSHEKSQVSELVGYMGLWLDPKTGTHLYCPKAARLISVYNFMNDHPQLEGSALDKEIMFQMSCSEPTARRLRHMVEDGLFPGYRWLGIKGKDEDAILL